MRESGRIPDSMQFGADEEKLYPGAIEGIDQVEKEAQQIKIMALSKDEINPSGEALAQNKIDNRQSKVINDASSK